VLLLLLLPPLWMMMMRRWRWPQRKWLQLREERRWQQTVQRTKAITLTSKATEPQVWQPSLRTLGGEKGSNVFPTEAGEWSRRGWFGSVMEREMEEGVREARNGEREGETRSP